jgi:hypothetical protein
MKAFAIFWVIIASMIALHVFRMDVKCTKTPTKQSPEDESNPYLRRQVLRARGKFLEDMQPAKNANDCSLCLAPMFRDCNAACDANSDGKQAGGVCTSHMSRDPGRCCACHEKTIRRGRKLWQMCPLEPRDFINTPSARLQLSKFDPKSIVLPAVPKRAKVGIIIRTFAGECIL